ncbi:MAG: F0F1 ATP synthase subunit B [Candidatus Didemnitutus sp.]|nr:F0F1 ATP synthase subunit B [Candidatus Didemnitutus sp.]
MLPLLLAVTEAAATTGEPSIVEKFGIEWHYVVWQIASFLILFVVLYKFGIKPTIATMEARNQKIETGLKHAEEMQAKLAATAQESTQIIKQAQLEAQKFIDEARRVAKDLSDKQQAEALQRSADMIARAQQASELAHRKMLDQARSEIARLVVTTTERVLAKQLTDADRAAYNATATKELSVL